eukprot:CAMPEP_0183711044 /NCGR_PEP_ID=MMETSP0737-20130205/6642_1 /TAXON_ID=385413 /ORGANISM="Thalassiosira miniscula, Strain CCMP1093" /LENGTH=147 /DNA_ID=CAMNT_0025939449 /DNA_START=189 /DNA_END=632 /DNA_ORIENTATION=-
MTSDPTAADSTASSTMPQTGAEGGDSPSTFSNVPWPVRPSPGINYNFVSIMYVAGSSLALLFYTLETQMASLLEEKGDTEENSLDQSNQTGATDDTEEGVDPWKEFAKGMEGMYFIFLPFVPCLLWSLIVRYYWLKGTAVSREKKDK